MTSLMGAKKRAEEFAAAVDGTGPREPRPEIVELVGLVDALRTHEVPSPRPEFAASLRERLVAEAQLSLATDAVLTLPVRRRGTRERRLAIAATSFVLVGGSAGMAVAAQSALPGDALYPIKRGLEKAQSDLATSPASRGHDLLDQAGSRLDEVRGLITRSTDQSQVPATLEDFTRQAVEGSNLLLDSFEDDRDPAKVAEVRSFAAQAVADLQELAKTAAPDYQDELASAATALLAIDERASSVCPTCASDLPTLQMPQMLLTASEADRALEAVRRVDLNNDHPVITDLPRLQPKAPPTPGAGPTGTPESPALEPPTLPGLPSGELGAGGGADDGVTDKLDDATGGALGKTRDEAKETLPDDLDPIIDTLLP